MMKILNGEDQLNYFTSFGLFDYLAVKEFLKIFQVLEGVVEVEVENRMI